LQQSAVGEQQLDFAKSSPPAHTPPATVNRTATANTMNILFDMEVSSNSFDKNRVFNAL
jgi:hypothetical protein